MSARRARIGIRTMVCVVLGTWYAVAVAAVDAVQSHHIDLLAFPWAQAGVAVLLTVGAGLPATWARELAAVYADRPFDLRREMRRDIAVSIVLGIGGYAAGILYAASSEVVALGLVIAGYGGTRVISAFVERIIGYIRRPQQ